MRNALGAVDTVLVLGGGSEIGLAVAHGLVRSGARTVVLAGRQPGKLMDGGRRLREAGATSADCVAFDADDTGSHAAAIGEMFARYGDIDVVVVAFGVLGTQADAEADAQVAVALTQTNYVGAVSALTLVANRLRTQGHGDIVVLSSVAGERIRRSNYIYGSTKAGLDAFSQGLAAALVGSGVHLLIVRPGFVHTKMTSGLAAAPLSTTAEMVADATVRGLRRRARVVWVPTTLRWIMIVLRHLPTVALRRLPA